MPVCLNTLLTTEQYRYMLSDSRAQALVVSAQLLDVVAPLLGELPELELIIVSGGKDGAFIDLHTSMQAADTSFKTIRTSSDETAFWLYSSGSTGAPKGVRHIQTSPAYVAAHYGKHVLGIRQIGRASCRERGLRLG